MATFYQPLTTNYPQTKSPFRRLFRTGSSFPLLANFNRRCPNPRLFLCHASFSPQPPPQSEPPPGGSLKGAASELARFQERVQIFFAVLFWMSLFFWSSAWDGNNKGSGRSNRGSRFRR